MKKLPKVFQNELKNNIKNNKRIYDSLNDIKEGNKLNISSNKDNNKSNNNKLSVKEKIKKLIDNNNYIFNTQVTLIFNDYEKVCSIAGVVNNHIITMDNEIIKIDDIKDIKY